MNAKKFYKPKRAFKKRAGAKLKPYRKSKLLQSTVKKELMRQVETKSTNDDPIRYPFTNSTNNNTLMFDAVELTNGIKTMGQGTASGQRIGNEISISRAVLNINLTMDNGFEDIYYPYIVSVFIGYIKGQRVSLPTAPFLAAIFNDGGGSTGITGSTMDLLRNINRDRFICRRFQFKVGTARPTTNSGQTYSNNDFPLFINKKISLKEILGTVKFTNDNFSGITRDLYMWCSVHTSTGETITSSQTPILNYYTSISYKDV